MDELAAVRSESSEMKAKLDELQVPVKEQMGLLEAQLREAVSRSKKLQEKLTGSNREKVKLELQLKELRLRKMPPASPHSSARKTPQEKKLDDALQKLDAHDQEINRLKDDFTEITSPGGVLSPLLSASKSPEMPLLSASRTPEIADEAREDDGDRFSSDDDEEPCAPPPAMSPKALAPISGGSRSFHTLTSLASVSPSQEFYTPRPEASVSPDTSQSPSPVIHLIERTALMFRVLQTTFTPPGSKRRLSKSERIARERYALSQGAHPNCTQLVAQVACLALS